jgi:hypothetical protein
MKVEPAHTLVEKLVSSQSRDYEQFRLEPTVIMDLEGKSSFCHLPLLFRILLEWNNTWLRYKRRLSPLSIVIMDLEERLLLRHWPLS